MKGSSLVKLIVSIAGAQLAGVIGSLFTTPAIDGWYRLLAKPELTPPSWVFGPVWITLFTLMGIAAFVVWNKGVHKKQVRIALWIYVGQLILNALWSLIFFGLNNPGAAFIEIILLWIAILVTICVFVRISKSAAWLMVPYLLWVTYAIYLNYSIWVLNA